jgi:hypothetical protein
MKVYVRHGDRELMFPSFKDFQTMYRLKFIAPDDLVRRETSDRWIAAGDLPELRNLSRAERETRYVSTTLYLMVAVLAFALMIRFFLFSPVR